VVLDRDRRRRHGRYRQGVAFAVDPSDHYYNVSLGDGGPPLSFPRTIGHYSFKPAPAVSVQTQIAP